MRYISAPDACAVLLNLLAIPCSPADSKLVLYGTDEQAEVVKNLLDQLDVRPSTDDTVKIFSLEHANSELLASVVSTIAPNTDIAVDNRTNSLVATGPADQLNVIEAALIRLDQPGDTQLAESTSSNTYEISLFWLMENAATKAGKPERRIGGAVAALARHGFDDIGQLEQPSIAVKAGGSFMLRSVRGANQLMAEGQLEHGGGGWLHLTLQIRIDETTVMSTEITTKPEHDVVLGVAGTDHDDSRSAFVIRIEPSPTSAP